MATPQEQLARIRKQAEALQGKVNTLADAKRGGMEQTEQTTVQDAQRFLNRPAPAPATTPDGSVEAETLQSGGTPELPTPTATTEQEGFQAGLEASITSAKANLDTTLKTSRDDSLKRQEALNKQMESLMKKSDPTERGTFDQEQRIIQNQLDAAETASATLEEDFNKRRSVVGELDRLLTEGNQAIQQAQGMPVAMSVLNKNITQTAQMVQARAGVLNAVISGLDGNVNAAHSIINNSSNAVAAVWNDQLAYNNAYMNLVGNGELAKNKIHDDYAQSQIMLAESKLSQLEETKNYITELMIDPQSAQFIADAGITLNDSVDEINTKMATETKRVEREDVKNELLMEGYEYVPFPGDRDDVVTLDVGGQQMSFVPPLEPVTGGGSGGGSGGFTPQETRKLEQAGLNGASRQEQLDFLYGGDAINPSVALTPTQERSLISAGLLAVDVQQIQQDVSEFGLDEVLAGIDDEAQRNAVAEAYGRETKTTPATPEEVKTKIVNTLTNIKSTYTRSEAEDVARANLEEALGSGSLPTSFEDALQDALVEVYGRTFWQSVLPGGR